MSTVGGPARRPRPAAPGRPAGPGGRSGWLHGDRTPHRRVIARPRCRGYVLGKSRQSEQLYRDRGAFPMGTFRNRHRPARRPRRRHGALPATAASFTNISGIVVEFPGGAASFADALVSANVGLVARRRWRRGPRVLPARDHRAAAGLSQRQRGARRAGHHERHDSRLRHSAAQQSPGDPRGLQLHLAGRGRLAHGAVHRQLPDRQQQHGR